MLLNEDKDVCLSVDEDDAIAAVAKNPNGSFVEIEINSSSKDVRFEDAVLFAALAHEYDPTNGLYSVQKARFLCLINRDILSPGSSYTWRLV